MENEIAQRRKGNKRNERRNRDKNSKQEKAVYVPKQDAQMAEYVKITKRGKSYAVAHTKGQYRMVVPVEKLDLTQEADVIKAVKMSGSQRFESIDRWDESIRKLMNGYPKGSPLLEVANLFWADDGESVLLGYEGSSNTGRIFLPFSPLYTSASPRKRADQLLDFMISEPDVREFIDVLVNHSSYWTFFQSPCLEDRVCCLAAGKDKGAHRHFCFLRVIRLPRMMFPVVGAASKLTLCCVDVGNLTKDATNVVPRNLFVIVYGYGRLRNVLVLVRYLHIARHVIHMIREERIAYAFRVKRSCSHRELGKLINEMHFYHYDDNLKAKGMIVFVETMLGLCIFSADSNDPCTLGITLTVANEQDDDKKIAFDEDNGVITSQTEMLRQMRSRMTDYYKILLYREYGYHGLDETFNGYLFCDFDEDSVKFEEVIKAHMKKSDWDEAKEEERRVKEEGEDFEIPGLNSGEFSTIAPQDFSTWDNHQIIYGDNGVWAHTLD